MARAKPSFPQLQRGDPLARGLVAAYQFYEGAGNTLHDVSGNRNDGTLVNSPTWVGGRAGHALSFNGSSQYVVENSALPAVSSGGSQSACAWIKTTANSGAIFSERSTTSGSPVFDMALQYTGYTGANGTLGIITRYDNNTGTSYSFSTQTVNDGKWHHVCMVLNQTSGSLIGYIDGKQSQSSSVSGTGSITTTASQQAIGSERAWVSVGQGTTAQQYFNGSIDDVRIYNRALSADEVRLMYVRTGGLT